MAGQNQLRPICFAASTYTTPAPISISSSLEGSVSQYTFVAPRQWRFFRFEVRTGALVIPWFIMSFTVTSHGVTIRSDSVLTSQCQLCNGDWKDSSITLDDFLGNDDGFFLPGGGGFSTSASDIRISCDAGGPTTLHAELQRRDGSWHKDSIDLDNFIRNDDGILRL